MILQHKSAIIQKIVHWLKLLFCSDPLAPKVRIYSIFPNWPQNLKCKNNYSFALLDIQYANPKYILKECPTESVVCKTSEHLGVEGESQIQVFTKEGEIFADLVMPKGYPFVYHRILPSHEFINDYYKSEFDLSILNAKNGSGQNSKNVFQKSLVNKVEQYCSDLLKPKSKVLDVGCGYGDQLLFFLRSGHEVIGIEPGRQRAEQAQLALQSKVYEGNIESAEVYNLLERDHGKFDLIYLNQVLEHLFSPVEVLKQLLTLLAPDGLLFILVPDFYTESVLNKILSVVHTHSFTADGLRKLMGMLGMVEVRSVKNKHYNFMLFKKNGERTISDSHKGSLNVSTASIERHIKSQFGLIGSKIFPSDILIQSSRLLGDAYATYSFIGPESVGKSPHEGNISSSPVHVYTKFDRPSFIFK